MGRPRGLSFAVVFVTVLVMAAQARAASIVLERVVVIPSLQAQNAYFGLTFSSPPDFETTDDAGRPSTSFQFYIDTAEWVQDLRPFYDAHFGYRSNNGLHLVRSGDTVPYEVTVLDIGLFPNDGPGGWGPVAWTTPFTQSGPFVSFTLPLAQLDAAFGTFYYRVEAYEYGGWNGQALSGQASVPDATSSLLLLSMGLAGLATMRKRLR